MVELSNLQRQIAHTTAGIGSPKVASLAASAEALNPGTRMELHQVRLAAGNGAVLMEDTVVVSAGDVPAGSVPDVAAPPVTTGTFRSFSDVERNPVAGIDALRAVFRSAAAGVVHRMT